LLDPTAMRLRAAVVAVTFCMTVAAAADPSPSGVYRIEGVSARATRASGELRLERTAQGLVATRRVELFPEGRRVRLGGVARWDGKVLAIDFEGARARYVPDGRGGLVGRFDGEREAFEELLAPVRDASPVPGDLAAILSAARSAKADARELRALIEELHERGVLYRTLRDAPPLERRELAGLARAVAPPDPAARENEAFERAFARARRRGRFDLLIVPGFTPVDAPRLHEISAGAKRRCARVARDFQDGRAPFILATGGPVHPHGTPVIEALELKTELLRLGVPAERIAVETRARHSTTNLRNAGRFMLGHGLKRGLVVTSFDQSFYFSYPRLSTFGSRCREELGFVPGELGFVDQAHTRFEPDQSCLQENPEDPFDP
jgi:hypothetical protein